MRKYSNDLSNENNYYSMDNDDIIEIKENNNNSKNNQNANEELLTRNSIRLLSYNFFLRPPPINNNGSDYKNERLKDFFEFLREFDIICFQEIFTTLTDRKHQMIREAAKSGLKYHVSSRPPSFFSEYITDSGLLILSRYEILECDYYYYYLNISGDAPSNKGIIYAKININNRYLFLFNTHLQSTYFDESQSNINCTIQVRTKQTEELINFVYNKLMIIPREQIEKGLVLIVGDFNIDAHNNQFLREKYKLPKYKISEYDLLKKKLNKLGIAIDIMNKKYNNHLYTFGNNDRPEYDQVFTGKAEFNMKQTLDYMWEIIPDYELNIYNKSFYKINDDSEKKQLNKNEEDDNKINVLYQTFKVQEFLVKNRPYQQLSDHFGISVELSLPNKNKDLSENLLFNSEFNHLK
jgi:endonuclease/exonuclease/phosphatase family metal-dependent hydrolase